jgi:cyclopropane fatty-acyl-phospholipid synthase-like methyltransferase
MINRTSYTPDYFERLYSKDPDPWKFASSDYERLKYGATLGAARSGQLGMVFEIGCSIGVFTRMLAPNCRRILAVDVSERALSSARHNCRGLDNVTIRKMRVPHDWPEQRFDLIILSEVLYFLAASEIRATAKRSIESLCPFGRIILVNWLGETDYPCGGDESAGIFLLTCAEDLKLLRQYRNSEYRLDLLAAAPSYEAEFRERS